MTPEDKEWLEMDIEDSVRLAEGEYEIPFYESEEWINQFGRKPYVLLNLFVSFSILIIVILSSPYFIFCPAYSPLFECPHSLIMCILIPLCFNVMNLLGN